MSQTEFDLLPASGPICGVDEAGRGPLVGAVVAAAVVLNPDKPIQGLADSKVLSESQRESLAELIRRNALDYSIAQASPAEIDELNILHATMLAMQRAVNGLRKVSPCLARIDGNRAPQLECAIQTIVGGDALDPAISAASILAKTTRDEQMRELHREFPIFGFDRHKGYPTQEHRRILAEHGPCAEHRRSFAPVARALDAKRLASKTEQ
jgi:ribonuclease HII